MDESSQSAEEVDALSMWAAFDDALEPEGFQIEGFDILSELNRGGMGVVYHARQHSPEREVALKVMLPKYANDPDMRERFQREARAMAALEHSGILPIYEVGEVDGASFFSMKLARGGTLYERLESERPDRKLAVDWMISICSAVHYAHQRGVLHRDLKPANFLFDDEGQIYVGDFGVAKLFLKDEPSLTQTQAFVGTPHYLPPEIASGEQVVATTSGDVYSLGAVLFQILTGRQPYVRSSNMASLLRSISSEPLPSPRSIDPQIPVDLSVICSRATERSPSERYSSVASLQKDLERWRDGEPIKARPVSAAGRLLRWSRRHPLPAALSAALVVMTLVGTVVLTQLLQETRWKLRESLLGEAKSERLAGRSGHRDRIYHLLREARNIRAGDDLRTEMAATLAHIDVAAMPLEQDRSRMMEDQSMKWVLERDERGILHLIDTGTEQRLRSFAPSDWGPAVGSFSADGSRLVIVGAEEGSFVFSGLNMEQERALHVERSIRFAAVSPDGTMACLGGRHGLSLIDLDKNEEISSLGPGPMRCAPAWSPNGEVFAICLGAQKRIDFFQVDDRLKLVDRLRLSDWPESMAFDQRSGLFAVSTVDSSLRLFKHVGSTNSTSLQAFPGRVSFKDRGDLLMLESKNDPSLCKVWRIYQTIGFHEWMSPVIDDDEVTVFSLRESGDGRFLLVTTTKRIEFWDVRQRKRVGYYATGNQRIDARTDAWWLPGEDRSILVQVPGALEQVWLKENGTVDQWKELKKVPGASILEIRDDESWLVEIRDDDDETSLVVWPNGDDQREVPYDGNVALSGSQGDLLEKAGTTAQLQPDGRIVVGGRFQLTLTPPFEDDQIQSITLSASGNEIFGFTRRNQIFDWDLNELENHLITLGFKEEM